MERDWEAASSDEAGEAGPPCNHSKKSVDCARALRAVRRGPAACSCGAAGAWLCLQCGERLCGESHARAHFETPRSQAHALAARLAAPLRAHCQLCQRDVRAPDRKLRDCLDQLARALQAPPPAPPAAAASTPLAPSRVRGLSNLGNTCFFNSVLQCLARTPFLVDVLQEISEPGETFRLPGGDMPAPPEPAEDGEERKPTAKTVPVDPISGELAKWGALTETLTEALRELRTVGRADVYNPRKLFNQFVAKVPQFAGGDQHDGHELLRHLLEAVRSEDLRRYHSVILEKFGLNSKEKRTEIEDETRLKVKFYGQQAADADLRPGQVFRGVLVSTLECQDCKNCSHTTEHFLDLSLPIMADKPQPPSTQRRKNQEDQANAAGTPEGEKSKQQLKREKKANRKSRKNNKRNGPVPPQTTGSGHNSTIKTDENERSEELVDGRADNKSSSEQSDADVEDNVDDNPKPQVYAEQRDNNSASYCMESGYNSEKVISSDSIRASPVDMDNKEKSDKSPERMDKDFNEMKFTAVIPLPYKPLNSSESPQVSNPDSGVASPETAKRALSDVINAESPATGKELGSPASLSSEINMDISSPRQSNNSPVCAEAENNTSCLDLNNEIAKALEKQKMNELIKSNQFDKINNTANGLANLDIYEGTFGPDRKYDPNSYDSCSFPSAYEPEKSNDYVPNNVQGTYSELILNQTDEGENSISTSPEFDFSKWKKDTNTLSNRNFAVPSRSQYEEGECSIQSCLNQFTSAELLTGNNKVGCETCTKRANTGKTVYTNATKRFRVSNLPAVMILHLKRFQLGPRCILRKIAKHVNFPTVLDIGPFCSEDVKKMPSVSPNQNKILYSLYGVVEHSGSMHLGHYVAYVKVRPDVKLGDPRRGFLPVNTNKKEGDVQNGSPMVNGTCNDDTDSSLSGYESGEGAVGGSEVNPPSGKWYYISDSQVSETTEDKVLKATAYLLFYERIL